MPEVARPIVFPPSEIYRVGRQHSHQHAPTLNPRLYKIFMISINRIILLIVINGDYSYINDQLLKKLRKGDLSANLTVIVLIVYTMCSLSGENVFSISNQIGNWNAPTVDPGFGLNPDYGSETSRPQAGLQIEKSSPMPQQNYSNLMTSERRKLADPLGQYGSINIDGFPRFDLKFNQIEFKTPKHGRDHGLSTDDNWKMRKTEINTLALRDSLIDMPNKPKVICYKEGVYQGGTPRGCKSVNVFDPDTNLIAVYQKYSNLTNLFLTTCKFTQMELDHLKANNSNFVTERILNKQSVVSAKIIEHTNNNNGLQ